uniref:Type IV pilus assembly protein n=1 Tax=Neisseria meningitidis alpha275 TaxID=295996 RepID=C6SHV6_NEIME|nr:type IV pilus assembly protein [Neisseria meningitidis alpha275]
MLFSDGVISPKSLAALIARVFSYSILDLRHYPRHRVLMGVLTEEQMVEFHCVPGFPVGSDKVFFAVFRSDPDARKFRKPFPAARD